MEGLSERAYAAHAGLSRGAVQKARKTGRLVLFKDGSINAAASDARRAATTDPDQQRRALGGAATAAAGSPNAGPRQAQEQGEDPGQLATRARPRSPASANLVDGASPTPAVSGPGDSTSYLKARTALTVYQAQERQLAIQKKKGVLVDRARAETLVFRLARQERDLWVTWPTRVGETWIHEKGAAMTIAKLAIDTGYESAAVYAWARAQGSQQVAPVKGYDGFNRASPVSGPTFVDATENGRRLKRGARLWSVATASFKAETYRYLRLERPSNEDRGLGVIEPPGFIHLPSWIDSEWLKQLVAEQLVTLRDRRGYARQEWQKLRERNEALDTRVYARAASWILGADRFDERMWRQLEAQAGVETSVAPTPPVGTVTAPLSPNDPSGASPPTEPQAGRIHAPRRRGWRVSTPRYMD